MGYQKGDILQRDGGPFCDLYVFEAMILQCVAFWLFPRKVGDGSGVKLEGAPGGVDGDQHLLQQALGGLYRGMRWCAQAAG